MLAIRSMVTTILPPPANRFHRLGTFPSEFHDPLERRARDFSRRSFGNPETTIASLAGTFEAAC